MAKPKILIVEDDPFSVQLLRHNLKSYNAEILPVANTAADALKIIGEYEPDVALLDIYLAGEQDGLEVARAIQQNYDIPIIYLTGYSSEEIFEQAKLTDPFGYILKPFTPKELTVTLDMALYKHNLSKELRQSRALLSTTLEALSEAVLTTDADFKIVYANNVAKSSFGLLENQAVVDVLKMTLPQSDQPLRFEPEIFNGSKAPVCKLKTNKGEIWARIGVLDLPKATPGHVLVIRDVTGEYENQKAAQTVFEALESLNEGLLLLNPETDKIIFASAGFEKLTGYSPKDVVGEAPQFLFGAKTIPTFWPKAKDVLASKGYAKLEGVIYNKEGVARLAEWQFSRMPSPNNKGNTIIMLRDITDHRQLEEDLRQSQKIEAVGRLAGGVAHDFNNLLSVINSYSDLMTLKLPANDPMLKYVGNIRMAGQRAADLVAKLLTFSRRDTAKPTLLDVRTVTEEVYKMLRRVIREDIEISLEFGDQLGALYADQLQLEQVIMNLSVNARDAIGENGGRIRVGWSQQSVAADVAAKKKIAAGDYLVLTVEDNGSGMPKEVLERIFEPYFTTKPEGKGTGLGMSIVQAIVTQVKGAIEVESTEGKGTSFRLFFPASVRPSKGVTLPPMNINPSSGTEHILVVEDEESFADCLQGVMTLHGYTVHYARDAATAIDLFEQHAMDIKLLITDMVLPAMSGKELATKLKGVKSDLKVIFITGYENPEQILKDFEHPALVLQKPFSVVSILNKVREVLDNQQTDKKIQKL